MCSRRELLIDTFRHGCKSCVVSNLTACRQAFLVTCRAMLYSSLDLQLFLTVFLELTVRVCSHGCLWSRCRWQIAAARASEGASGCRTTSSSRGWPAATQHDFFACLHDTRTTGTGAHAGQRLKDDGELACRMPSKGLNARPAKGESVCSLLYLWCVW